MPKLYLFFYRSLKSHLPTQPKDRGSALVAINEWLAYFNVRWNNFRVAGGQEVVVKIQPVDFSSSGSFRELDVTTRKCRFHDELNVGEMFRYRTNAGCTFQCRLEFAIMTAGCLPWNYPMPPNLRSANNAYMCKSSLDSSHNFLAKFEAAMSVPKATEECQCDSDCEHVDYTLQVMEVF